MYIHVHPWVCCVALLCCLFDLACFFLLPSASLINTYMYMSPPQFSRLGMQVSLAIICLFVWAMVGWVTLSFLFL